MNGPNDTLLVHFQENVSHAVHQLCAYATSLTPHRLVSSRVICHWLSTAFCTLPTT